MDQIRSIGAGLTLGEWGTIRNLVGRLHRKSVRWSLIESRTSFEIGVIVGHKLLSVRPRSFVAVRFADVRTGSV